MILKIMRLKLIMKRRKMTFSDVDEFLGKNLLWSNDSNTDDS